MFPVLLLSSPCTERALVYRYVTEQIIMCLRLIGSRFDPCSQPAVQLPLPASQHCTLLHPNRARPPPKIGLGSGAFLSPIPGHIRPVTPVTAAAPAQPLSSTAKLSASSTALCPQTASSTASHRDQQPAKCPPLHRRHTCCAWLARNLLIAAQQRLSSPLT